MTNKFIAICILLCISTFRLYSQTKIIKGRIIDSNLETLPNVSIFVDDTVEVGKTDLNGYFEIEIVLTAHKISIEYVGLEPTCIKLVDSCVEVEIVAMLWGTYDFTTFKKIDRLRMKSFKQLPQKHKEAFEKGLFKTEKACYIQEFVPRYPKKPRKD